MAATVTDPGWVFDPNRAILYEALPVWARFALWGGCGLGVGFAHEVGGLVVIKDFGRHRSLLQRLLSGMQQAQHTGWLPRQDCWPKALRRLCRPVAGA